MKKLIYVIILGVLFSCGEKTTQEKTLERKDILSEKSLKFLNKKIEKEESEDHIKSFTLDSIVPISSKKVEEAKTLPLINRLNKQIKLTEDLIEIDKKYGVGVSSSTEQAQTKTKELSDSLRNELERIKGFNDTDTLGYAAILSIDIEHEDGTTSKDIGLSLLFDLENDLRSDWNKSFD